MIYELPGLYKIDGIKTTVKAPNRTKFKTVIPLEYVAYNIVLPKIGKIIDKENYRKLIKENIRTVEIDKNLKCNDYYSVRRKEIKITLSALKLKKIGKALSAESGHAFSVENYELPLTNPDLMEYYDKLSQSIGEEELKNTRFSFKPSDKIGLSEDKEVQQDVKAAVKDFVEMAKKKIPQKRMEKAFKLYDKIENLAVKLTEDVFNELKSTGKLNMKKLNSAQEETNYITQKIGESVRIEFDSLKQTVDSLCDLLQDTGFYHMKGYSLAEIMYKNFGAKGSFRNYKHIFATRGGKVRLKSKILKKLPVEDTEKLRILEEKTAGISDFWHIREKLFDDLHAIINDDKKTENM